MNAVRHFFSFTGAGSPTRFAVAALLSVAIWWLISLVDYTFGLPTNIIAGIVAGAALAKLMVEAVRWSRRAGDQRPAEASPGWAGTAFAAACIAGGVIIVGGIAYISIGIRQDADRIEAWRAVKEHRSPDR